MGNKLYKLTAKCDIKVGEVTYEEGSQIHTSVPQNFPLEYFECVEQEPYVSYKKKKHLPKRRRKF